MKRLNLILYFDVLCKNSALDAKITASLVLIKSSKSRKIKIQVKSTTCILLPNENSIKNNFNYTRGYQLDKIFQLFISMLN